MAYLDPAEVSEIARQHGFTRFTPNTITELAKLVDELELTRKRGYALDSEEHEANTYCVGVAIFDSSRNVIGACSISGNDPEILARRQNEIAAQVRYTAQEISRRMGFVPETASQIIDHFTRTELSS